VTFDLSGDILLVSEVLSLCVFMIWSIFLLYLYLSTIIKGIHISTININPDIRNILLKEKLAIVPIRRIINNNPPKTPEIKMILFMMLLFFLMRYNARLCDVSMAYSHCSDHVPSGT
jgi:hypothetical protein